LHLGEAAWPFTALWSDDPNKGTSRSPDNDNT
jgi:hypothetical protein